MWSRVSMLCAILGFFSVNVMLAQGDDCATAAVLAGPGVYTADGPSAGAGASNVCFGGGGTNADWYSFTPATNGTMGVSSCSQGTGAEDTRLSIYDGSCGTLNCIGFADDCSYPTDLSSEVLGITVTGGTTYYIEWDDRWGSTTFDWELTFDACVPPAANYSTAEDCGLSTFTVDVDLTSLGSAATVNIYEIVNAGTPALVHSGVSALMVYTLNTYNPGDVVDVLIEDAASPSCNSSATGFSFCCGISTCALAAPAVVGLNTVTDITCGGGATGALGAGAVNAAWYSFTPPTTGQITVSSCALTAEDTRVTIHDGSAGCGAIVPLFGNDDCVPGSNFASELPNIPVTGGTTYFIEWDDRWSPNGFDWELTYISCLPPAATTSFGTIDCGAGTYEITVLLTDLGTSATVDISSDLLGVEHAGVSALTTYNMGPYPLGTPVTITLVHDADPTCNVILGPFNQGVANCPISTFPYCELFDSEALCVDLCGVPCATSNGYVQDGGDGTDWATWSGATTSGSTGPVDDVSGGGNYMYVEASTPCNPSVTGIIYTNEFDISGMVNEPQIQFWYHMRGDAGMGTLDVAVEDGVGSGNFVPLFSITGNQGPNWIDAGWISAFVANNDIRFRFTATTGSGFNSDIAIDEVCVRERPNCTSPTATASVIENCGAGTFTVSVDVTSTGDGASVNLSSDALGAEYVGVGVGTGYIMGPYTNGTPVTITVEHESVSACDIVLGTYNSCCGGTCATAEVAVIGTNTTPAMNCGGGASNAYPNAATGVNAYWFEYTAPSIGVLVASSCLPNNAGGVDTHVSLHKGPCGAFTSGVGDDDGCGGGAGLGLSSEASLVLGAGETAYIEWDDRWDGSGFDWDLSFTPCTPPATDICSSQTPFVIAPGDPTTTIADLDLSCSTDDAGIGGVFGVAGYSWVAFDLTACSDVSIDFCNSPPDFWTGAVTVALNMYKDCAATELVNSQSAVIDPCGNPRIDYFNLPPGSYKYPLLWNPDFPNDTVTVNITATIPVLPCAPDICADATPVSCGSNITSTTVSNAATQGPSVCNPNFTAPGPDAWFVYSATTAELVTASTCVGTTYNSMITVYVGAPDCTNLICLTGNDDNCGVADGGSEASWLTTPGTDYYIAVHGPDGFVNSTGEFTLDIFCNPACTPQPNADCGGAALLTPALVGTGTPLVDDNTCGFADPNPTCDVDLTFVPNAFAAQGLWYTFTNGLGTNMILTLDASPTAGLTASTMSYALYSGTCGALVEEACAVGVSGAQGLTGLVPGATYYLMVYNQGGVGNEGTFSVMLEAPAQLDAEVSAVNYPSGSICETDITPNIAVTNNGEQTITSLDITYDIDAGTPVVYNWTGTLVFGATFNIPLPSITTTPGPHTFNVAVSNPNGGVDEDPSNDAAAEGFSVDGEAVELHFQTDFYGDETSWEVYDAFFLLVASGPGSPYAGNTLNVETLCLPTLFGNCFSLFVFDAFNDGMCCLYGAGYWEVRTTSGDLMVRDLYHGSGSAVGSDIVDGTQSPAALPQSPGYVLGHEFCLPLGPSSIEAGDCNVFTNDLKDRVYATFVPGAGNYQFEFMNPDAGFRRFIATGQRYVQFSQLVNNPTYPLVSGTTYFARVRPDLGFVGFSDDFFGAGCEMAIDELAVPGCTQLIDTPGPTESCNVNRQLDVGQKLWARPVFGASGYQFRMENASEGYLRFLATPSYVLNLNTWAVLPMQVGFTYDVTVQVFVAGQPGGFCGAPCTVTILAPPPATSGLKIDEAAATGVSLYPNPVRDGQVQLMLTDLVDEEQNITVDVFDLFGKRVMAKEYGNSGSVFNTIMDVDDLAAGTYMVHITINEETLVERLMVH